ncbi:hypothetical protein [Paenibacillus gansuensis]|uniref:Uncharacterized protein n=1 Tax=Paenibacillus gansuensis TaxID=306542 RepID=A0ABW5PIM4_9BACL
MKRLFLVYDDKDFGEWIEDELAEYGRFVRSLEGMDFFFPQWNAVGPADVIILPETVIKSQESFLNLYETVKTDSRETIFLLIYHRKKDLFIERMLAEGNVCISYDELDTGILEDHLRSKSTTASLQKQTVQDSGFTQEEETKQAEVVVVPAVSLEPFKNRNDDSVPEEKNEQFTLEKDDPTVLSQKHELHKSVPAQLDEILKPKELATLETSESDEDKPHYAGNQTTEDIAQQRKETKTIEQEIQPKPVHKRRTAEEQKAKLQRIKERIIIEEKIITKHVPVHFKSMLVSIVSLYPRAGATFVTSNFARMLGENNVPVAVLEPVSTNMGSTYYELMYGEKNAPKAWKSWAEQLLANGYISEEGNWISGGVNWIPSSIEPTPEWSEQLNMQLLLAAKRFPVTLCDISSQYHEPQNQKIMSMSDEIWIIADGDPLQLSLHYKQIDKFKNDFPSKPLKIIGNKWSRYIKQSEWKEAVQLPMITQVPDLGPIAVKHLWGGKVAWEDTRLKNSLALPFKPLARAVMAKELFQLMKKHYGISARLKHVFTKFKKLDDEIKIGSN